MASSFFFVAKKEAGALRPCQDYRDLNNGTIKNRYPLPLVTDLMDKLKTAKIFMKLDLRNGYNNIRIKDGDQWKAVFKTPRGLFEPMVMFFGLMNSLATFQAFMNDILKDFINEGWCVVYMDNILIFSDEINIHRLRTRHVLERLWENNLYLKPEKCEFEVTKMLFLGLGSA
ncbi:reverse transcriptase-rnase h-integrase [Moniliophthora roreri MCA 2997]|uniref:Reverse transcriptase-rnase h-integrase n=1 Tax=Moniliophthora roreri (strain MCA 2997) TaxID=1381753 RepID=V2X865_MONRO|nr:reverse transcriptase-rnase h-integrase [Moniliophthora roreri MCA 2997]